MASRIAIAFFLFSFATHAQGDIEVVGNLPQEIWETSGLIFYNDRLITHNDSGNTTELFELDTTSLQITRRVIVENASNTDWEDITQDNDFIYIGDFGNNNGDRQDLNVLKISKAEYDVSDSVTAERIDFIYEDQDDFSTTPESDWDAEAFFSKGDDLIILTKQWQSQGTVAYRIPKLPGAFLAERLDGYQVDGLVTGATFDDSSNELYLVGYSQFLVPFFVQVKNVQNNAIFTGEKIKENLSVGFAQMEAISLVNETFYTSSEDFNNTNPPVSSASQLFRFTLNPEEMEEEEEEEEEEENTGEEGGASQQLVLYRPFGSKILNYRLNFEGPIFGRGIFDSVGRLILFTPLEDLNSNTNSVDLSVLRPSVYHLAFFYGDSIISRPFLLN